VKKKRFSVEQIVAILKQAELGIPRTDPPGIMQRWNRGAEGLFGYTEAEAIGRPITIFVPDELRDEEKEILRRAEKGEHVRCPGTGGQDLAIAGRSLVTYLAVSRGDGTTLSISTVTRPLVFSSASRAQVSISAVPWAGLGPFSKTRVT
jgi:PAS domain-containing protein